MMDGTVIRADAEGFIWLIVGVFWVIAQIAGAAARKKQPPRPPRSGAGEERGTPADPIAELLRKMAGVEEFHIEPPEAAGEQTAEPAFASVNPWKPGDIEALPEITPLRRAPLPAPEPAAKSLKVPEFDIRPKMSAFRSSVPSIKLPAMNLSFQGSETSVRKVSDLQTVLNPADKKSIRRAMLSHIIFSPPKALEQSRQHHR